MRWLLFSLLFLFLGASHLLGETRPNILLIYTDDHSYRTVSCYPESYDWVHTPNIDALAESGVRFAHATIGTWCMPSRATILTGKHQYGVMSMRMEGPYPGSEYDPEQCPFWPAVFRKNGYQTAHIGKWHTGTDTGYGRDWDYQIVWNRPRYPKNSGHYYYDQLIEKNGGEAEMVGGYSTDNYTDWAVDYLSGKEGKVEDKPWFLWLCYGGVHGPFTPAERHRDAYPDAKVPDPADIYPPRPGKPEYAKNFGQWVKDPEGFPVLKRGRGRGGIEAGGKTLTDWVRQVNQAVMALDEGIGRVVEALKESGQYENTLVILTSDQGFAWGQHGFQVKLAPYDANIRSPLIVSMPSRFPQGKVCSHPVGGTDLAPTIFATAGFELPWKMHGHDLTPLLKEPEMKEWSHPALTVNTYKAYGADTYEVPVAGGPRKDLLSGQGIPWWVSLVKGKYKYIRTLVEGEVEELYDLENDPDELVNLATRDSSHNAIVEEMRQELIEEMKRTDAKLVEKLPGIAALPE